MKKSSAAHRALNKKLKLERVLYREVAALFKDIVAKSSGPFFDVGAYEPQIQTMLLGHYRRVFKVFGDDYRQENKLDIPKEISDRLASTADIVFDRHADKQAHTITRTNQKQLTKLKQITNEQMPALLLINPDLTFHRHFTDLYGAALLRRVEAIAVYETQWSAEFSKAYEVFYLTTGGGRIQTKAKYMPSENVKRWDAMGDDKMRDWHAEADSQIVPITEPFIVKGEELMYPGDDTLGATASNLIHCRCTVSYEITDPESIDLTQFPELGEALQKAKDVGKDGNGWGYVVAPDWLKDNLKETDTPEVIDKKRAVNHMLKLLDNMPFPDSITGEKLGQKYAGLVTNINEAKGALANGKFVSNGAIQALQNSLDEFIIKYELMEDQPPGYVKAIAGYDELLAKVTPNKLKAKFKEPYEKITNLLADITAGTKTEVLDAIYTLPLWQVKVDSLLGVEPEVIDLGTKLKLVNDLVGKMNAVPSKVNTIKIPDWDNIHFLLGEYKTSLEQGLDVDTHQLSELVKLIDKTIGTYEETANLVPGNVKAQDEYHKMLFQLVGKSGTETNKIQTEIIGQLDALKSMNQDDQFKAINKVKAFKEKVASFGGTDTALIDKLTDQLMGESSIEESVKGILPTYDGIHLASESTLMANKVTKEDIFKNMKNIAKQYSDITPTNKKKVSKLLTEASSMVSEKGKTVGSLATEHNKLIDMLESFDENSPKKKTQLFESIEMFVSYNDANNDPKIQKMLDALHKAGKNPDVTMTELTNMKNKIVDALEKRKKFGAHLTPTEKAKLEKIEKRTFKVVDVDRVPNKVYEKNLDEVYKTNYFKVPNLTDDEAAVVQYYKNGSEHLNSYSRNVALGISNPDTDPTSVLYYEKLNQVIKKSEVKEDITVFRGIGKRRMERFKDLVPGDVLGIPEFQSTSLRKKTGEHFKTKQYGNDKAVLEILVPKGSKALYADPAVLKNYLKYEDAIISKQVEGKYLQEFELILPPGGKYKILERSKEHMKLAYIGIGTKSITRHRGFVFTNVEETIQITKEEAERLFVSDAELFAMLMLGGHVEQAKLLLDEAYAGY